MNLSEIKNSFPSVEILRDALFESVGIITHTSPNMLVFLESDKFLPQFLKNPNISCVITTEQLARLLPQNYGIGISDNPRKAFFEYHNHLALKTDFYWKDFSSEISDEAIIHETAYIATKNIRIGRGTIIEPNVTVMERSIIGEDVILRAGCVIGSEGFEFKRINGKIVSVIHAGGVRLHDRVEVQANCTISRSVFAGFTDLGEDTKLDNLVHVAHDVRIGKRCFLPACVMIAGSVTIGDDVWIGPNASISNGINIGDRAHITLGAVVTKDVKADERVSGNFAIDHQKFLAFIKSIR